MATVINASITKLPGLVLMVFFLVIAVDSSASVSPSPSAPTLHRHNAGYSLAASALLVDMASKGGHQADESKSARAPSTLRLIAPAARRLIGVAIKATNLSPAITSHPVPEIPISLQRHAVVMFALASPLLLRPQTLKHRVGKEL